MARKSVSSKQQGDNHPIASAFAKEISRGALVAGFWIGWLGALPLAVILRLAWPGWGTAGWLALAGTVLVAMDVHLTRGRSAMVARWMAPLTHLAGTGWLMWAVVAGFSRNWWAAWFIGGGSLAMLWSHWVHIRAEDSSTSLAALFGEKADAAGVQPMKILRVENLGKRVTGVLRLAHGVHGNEAVKAAPTLDAIAGAPPGTIKLTTDEDDANKVRMIISDPRTLRKSLPWPGPSMPGASIGDPIRPGTYQDGEPIAYKIRNHSLLVMGCTGSGKSLGWLWNEAAETVTRHDAAIIIADVTKGEQTVGPLRPAMHLVATTNEEAVRMLAGVHRSVRARTDALAARGLANWQPGCGLKHLTVWLEEAPDVINALEAYSSDAVDDWLSDIKAGRSAGIRWVLSCQRSDFSQMPTIVSSQLNHACFGVLKDKDAAFGLSSYQRSMDCEPELWGQRFPGMLYLDTPDNADDRKIMPARAFFWGEDSARILEHCLAYPASARPMDAVTAKALNLLSEPAAPVLQAVADLPELPEQPEEPEEGAEMPDTPPPIKEYNPETFADEYARGGRMADEETLDDPDGAIEFDRDSPLGRLELPEPGQRLSTTAAYDVLRRQLAAWATHGKTTFGAPDLADILERVGRQRTWLYEAMDKLTEEGLIVKLERNPVAWEIQDAA
jgi:hypothetical protein